MEHSIVLKKAQIIKSINFSFQKYKRQWEASFYKKDVIYMTMFNEMLFCETHGIYPPQAEKIFNELTKLHFGYTVEEINDLTQKLAENNIREAHNMPKINIITEQEMYAIVEYHKYLFADIPTKNEHPFKNII